MNGQNDRCAFSGFDRDRCFSGRAGLSFDQSIDAGHDAQSGTVAWHRRHHIPGLSLDGIGTQANIN